MDCTSGPIFALLALLVEFSNIVLRHSSGVLGTIPVNLLDRMGTASGCYFPDCFLGAVVSRCEQLTELLETPFIRNLFFHMETVKIHSIPRT
jgi:hypothetical protein